MNRTILLLALLILASCHKGNQSIENAFPIKQNPAWETEKFKTDYTIQFPTGFVGGVNGFEGNIFWKSNSADSTSFTYNYCNSLHCNDFGDTLKTTTNTAIQGVFNFKRDTIQLDQRVNFTKDNGIVGIYYHNEDSISYGKLFWKDDGFFKEALDVKYRKENNMRVIEIVGTIAKK
jgi:hypothetical protein